MNMEKIQNIADKIIATLPNSVSVITQVENQFNSSTFNMNDLAIPFTDSGIRQLVLLLDFQEVEINMNLGILSKVFEQIPVTENKFAKYGIRKTNRIFDPVIGFEDIKEMFQLSSYCRISI
jgi:hypothetical protein